MEPRPQHQEVLIRILGVGLVAIAALAVSLAVARQRSEERQAEPDSGPERAASPLDLDALRSAGM